MGESPGGKVVLGKLGPEAISVKCLESEAFSRASCRNAAWFALIYNQRVYSIVVITTLGTQ